MSGDDKKVMLTIDRVVRLARVMQMTPGSDGPWMWKSDNRWWLTGCVEGDQPIPQTQGVATMIEALDAAEGWFAPELDAIEMLQEKEAQGFYKFNDTGFYEHPSECQWHQDWHACNCGAFDESDRDEKC